MSVGSLRFVFGDLPENSPDRWFRGFRLIGSAVYEAFPMDKRTHLEVTVPQGHRRRANPISDCPLTAGLAAAGGKWKLIILYWLAREPTHFAGLRALMPSISAKVLTEQLRELIADEIVERHRAGPVPAPVYYSLTDYGRTLMPLVETVRLWGRGHIERFT
jgi:DNA-binding HxlR family transcriptional regulator